MGGRRIRASFRRGTSGAHRAADRCRSGGPPGPACEGADPSVADGGERGGPVDPDRTGDGPSGGAPVTGRGAGLGVVPRVGADRGRSRLRRSVSGGDPPAVCVRRLRLQSSNASSSSVRDGPLPGVSGRGSPGRPGCVHRRDAGGKCREQGTTLPGEGRHARRGATRGRAGERCRRRSGPPARWSEPAARTGGGEPESADFGHFRWSSIHRVPVRAAVIRAAACRGARRVSRAWRPWKRSTKVADVPRAPAISRDTSPVRVVRVAPDRRGVRGVAPPPIPGAGGPSSGPTRIEPKTIAFGSTFRRPPGLRRVSRRAGRAGTARSPAHRSPAAARSDCRSGTAPPRRRCPRSTGR